MTWKHCVWEMSVNKLQDGSRAGRQRRAQPGGQFKLQRQWEINSKINSRHSRYSRSPGLCKHSQTSSECNLQSSDLRSQLLRTFYLLGHYNRKFEVIILKLIIQDPAKLSCSFPMSLCYNTIDGNVSLCRYEQQEYLYFHKCPWYLLAGNILSIFLLKNKPRPLCLCCSPPGCWQLATWR